MEGWHWIRDTQLHEDARRYRGNGAGVMATLRTAALNLLRLAGFHSIRTGLQAVMRNITALLTLARRQPEPTPAELWISPASWRRDGAVPGEADGCSRGQTLAQ